MVKNNIIQTLSKLVILDLLGLTLYLLDPILKKLLHFGIELLKFFWDHINTLLQWTFGQLDAFSMRW